MDIVQFIVPSGNPAERPKQIFVTLNGSAEELTALAMVIDKAVHGDPQPIEVISMTGAPVRIIVDRLGPAMTAQ